MTSFLNINPEILQYIGILALGFFFLFVISKIITLNDKLFHGSIIEEFRDKSPDRTKVDHDKMIGELKDIQKKYLRRLHFPEHKENFLEELEEFEDNIKLEEALLLNQAMMLQKDAANNEKKQMWLDTVGGALNNYKYIREAINRVQSD
tara:strand:+ start:76 stop:522 length:447 start_codon:yes stop_codon:yes gene_type:complete